MATDATRAASVTRAFVLCPSFHGATLFARLLADHPAIVYLGDTNPASDDEACSCGRTVGECPFWQGLRVALDLEPSADGGKWLPRLPRFTGSRRTDRALSLMFAAADRIARRELDALASSAARDYRRLQGSLATYAREAAHARVFVDGEKSLTKALLLGSGARGPSPIIHLVRDPRGYVWSTMKREAGDPIEHARGWRKYHRSIRAVLRILGPGSGTVVRYEDLVVAPERTLTRVHRVLGVGTPMHAGDAFAAAQAHIIGNSTGADFERQIRLDESWRTGLGPRAAAQVLREAGGIAARLGYA
jgi:hypothetical protein